MLGFSAGALSSVDASLCSSAGGVVSLEGVNSGMIDTNARNFSVQSGYCSSSSRILRPISTILGSISFFGPRVTLISLMSAPRKTIN